MRPKNGIWDFFSFKKCGAEYRITESGKSDVFCVTLLQFCLLLGVLAPERSELKIVTHKEMKDYFGGGKNVASADTVLEWKLYQS